LPASLLQQSPSMKQRHPLARRASEFHALQKPRELSELLWLVEEHPPRSEGVRSDFEMYSPLVTKGGIVVFHDILDHDPGTGCEVSTYWNEIKDDYEHVEFAVAPYRWGGIGVLWKT
jgi:hypothetical protein